MSEATDQHLEVRRPLAPVLAAILLLQFAACGGGGNGEEATNDSRRPPAAPNAADSAPNVVVVMTDDQALDTMRAMPRTRRLLGGRGVTFEQAVASFPLCCPSRATFLTGQYAHNHGVRDNHPPRGGVTALDEEETLPVWLGDAGYRTALVGKYLNGYGKPEAGGPKFVPPGWDEWFVFPSADPRPFDYPVNDNGKLVRFGDSEEDYKTDVTADRAVRVVRRFSSGKRPFFLWVATSAPHTDKSQGPQAPRDPLPAPRHHGTRSAAGLPRGPAFDERDLSRKPAHLRGLPRIDTRRQERITRTYVSQLEALRAVDELVERLVAALRSRGELERTLFVFTADHGYLRGQHRLESGKNELYEEAIRVPLLVRGPGFPAGRRVENLVANVDVAATILEAAGVEPALPLDGRPLGAALERSGRERAILLESFERGSRDFRGVRTARYTYAERGGGDVELYDLERDPAQLRNVADESRFTAIRAGLQERLAELRDCGGSECR